MSAERPVETTAPPQLLGEQQAAPDAALEQVQPAAIATVEPPPPLVVGVPINPRTGEPRRPVVVILATVLCWLAVAITAGSLFWVYWDAIFRFAQASWLMGQFVTEKGSLERVLLAVAVTVVALIIGTANAIVGYYAFTGYRWTRIAGLISAALTCGALVLNQLGWYAIPAAVLGAALLWLPPSHRFFVAWTARRHPEQSFAPPTVDVVYGPLPRYRDA
jgi:hypothetical protein